MAACPNTNSKEWKDLVAEVGEISAYGLFIQNGYQVPVDSEGKYISQLDKVYNTPLKHSESLREITKIRNKMLASLNTKLKIYEGGKEEYIDKLKKTISEIRDADIVKSMLTFVNNADSNLKSLIERAHKEKDNIELLKTMDKFAGSYDIIEEVSRFANVHMNNPESEKYERNLKVKGKIDAVARRLKEFKDVYTNYARETVVNRLAAESTFVRAEYRERFKKEFDQMHPTDRSTLSAEERESQKIRFITQKLNDNNDRILTEEKKHIKELLLFAPKDIDGLTHYMVDPRSVNDQIIQLGVKLLDRADERAKDDFIEDQTNALKVWEKFIEGKQELLTDQKKLYGDILEKKNGKLTGFITRPLYSEVYDSRNAMFREVFALSKSERKKKGKDLIKAWNEKYLIDPKKKFDRDSVVNVKPEYRNAQYANLSTESKLFYNWFVSFMKESDSMVSPSYRLNYRLPSINQSFMEKISDQGITEIAKNTIKDTFKLTSEDHGFGELTKDGDIVSVLTDEAGNPIQRVSVPFRQSVEVSKQSFDLFNLAMMNRYVSRNFKEKTAIRTDMEVIKDLLAERRIRRTTGWKDIGVVQSIKSALGVSEEEIRELEIEGRDSNSYKLFESILEDRLYGRSKVKAGDILGVSIDKAAGFAKYWGGTLMLTANVVSATSNVLQGQVSNFFESTRKTHYDKKNLAHGMNKYRQDLHNSLNDYGKIRPESKTGLLLEKHLGFSAGFSASHNMMADTRLKRSLDIKEAANLNRGAEHFISGTGMYAYFDNLKITNKKGEYIDSSGNVVSRDKAMTYDEGFEVKDGKLKWKNGAHTPEGFNEYNEDTEFAIKRKIQDITADLQGNYAKNNQIKLQRYWYGDLAMFLRTWIPRYVQRRYRGIQYATTKREDLRSYQKFYSEASQEFKEGTYTSAIRFLNNLRTHGKLLEFETYSKNWSELSDLEKANVKAAAMEFTLMVAALTASSLLAVAAMEEPDDEDKELLYNMAYFNRRMYNELSFFTPMGTPELTRELQSPTPILSTISLANKALSQYLEDIFDWELETYKTGHRKGTSKSFHLTNELFNPFRRILQDKEMQESYKYISNPRY